ncbi:hypothetical protein C4565_00490 [Candidatus Parcubacteria bacterium]|nr:MAG: hypothetical protein C4565_00490 [Candidatus Parcubacteria bacterium]
MKAINARVEWNLNWANDPRVEILVEGFETGRKDMKYKTDGNGIYYAEKDGKVSFYYKCGDHQEDGFGGRHFELQMEDGTTKVLKGPWSSRAGCMNRAGFGPCVDVTIHDAEHQVLGDTWHRGGGWASAATLEFVEDALKKFLPEVIMMKENKHGDITYYPTLMGKTPQESKEYIRKLKEVEG